MCIRDRYLDCVNDPRIEKRSVTVKDIVRLVLRSAVETGTPFALSLIHIFFREGDAAQQVADLVAALKKDGHDFSVGIPMDTPCLLYTSRCV